MDQYEILTHPDPRLRLVAEPIAAVEEKHLQIAKRMLHTMYESRGIGLAATQVNIQKRIVVIDISDEKTDSIFLFNPIILAKEGQIEYQEGCLSVPGVYENVTRFERIQYEYLNSEGKKTIDWAEGLLSICIQHEIDHLDGKLFVDYLSLLKQRRITKKAKELQDL